MKSSSSARPAAAGGLPAPAASLRNAGGKSRVLPPEFQPDDVRSLHLVARSQAERSFRFFVERVLGLRLRGARVDELAAGAEPKGAAEARAACAWEAFQAGRTAELPPLARLFLRGGFAA